MPAFMLKKIVLGNFSSGPVDPMMADAIDFMVDKVRIQILLETLFWAFLCTGERRSICLWVCRGGLC